MPKLISKEQIKERDEIATKLSEATGVLNDAIEQFNATKSEAFAVVQEAIEAYNAKIAEAWALVDTEVNAYNEVQSEALDFLNTVSAYLQDKCDAKSDKWRDSEKGQACVEATSEWETLTVEEADLSVPEDLELEEPEDIESIDEWEGLANLPTEY